MSEFGQKIEGAASAEVEIQCCNCNDITLDGHSKGPFPTLADARAMRTKHKQYKTIELRDELARQGKNVSGREGIRALAELMVEEVGPGAQSADTYIEFVAAAELAAAAEEQDRRPQRAREQWCHAALGRPGR